MRAAGVVGVALMAAALAMGLVHQARTGEAGVARFVLRGIGLSLAVALLVALRSGVPVDWWIRLARLRSRGASR